MGLPESTTKDARHVETRHSSQTREFVNNEVRNDLQEMGTASSYKVGDSLVIGFYANAIGLRLQLGMKTFRDLQLQW